MHTVMELPPVGSGMVEGVGWSAYVYDEEYDFLLVRRHNDIHALSTSGVCGLLLSQLPRTLHLKQ